MKNSSRITITDIAHSLGISHATVSMALKGDVRVAEATRLKVVAAAQGLGYKPSRLAQGLKSGKSMLIGVVSDRSSLLLGERWEGRWLAGMHDAAREAGYRLLLNLPIKDEDRFWKDRPVSARGIEEMADGMVDGVLVIGGMALSKKELKLLELSGLPLVFAANDEVVPGQSQVLSGHAERFYRMTLELLARGHARIGVAGIAGAPIFNAIAQREIARAMKEKGLRFDAGLYRELATDHRPGMMKGWQAAQKSWMGREAVSAILFSYADQARFLEEVFDDLGLQPAGLPTLAAFGPVGTPRRRWWQKGILWDADAAQAGRSALKLLLDRMKGAPVTTQVLQWQALDLKSFWQQGEKD